MKPILLQFRRAGLAVGLAAFLMPALSVASSSKKTTLWDSAIEYKLIHIQNERASYDGLSRVVQKSKRGSENRVVLNTVYFEKEALSIWQDLERVQMENTPSLLETEQLLKKLEAIELAMKEGRALPRQLKEEALSGLYALEWQFKLKAWGDSYRDCLKKHAGSYKAKNEFIRSFKHSRQKTVEMHELSHLLDAQRNPGQIRTDPREFNRRSEIRAFFTELKYGENPIDSLWQAATGARLEISRGRFIDYSLTKLARVLGDKSFTPEGASYLATQLYHSATDSI